MAGKTQETKSEETEQKAPPVFVRYRGDGAVFIGVPARDLTKEEFDNLDPLQRRDVLAETIYEVVENGAN